MGERITSIDDELLDYLWITGYDLELGVGENKGSSIAFELLREVIKDLFELWREVIVIGAIELCVPWFRKGAVKDVG